jgi:hypothetical protein
VSNFLIYSNKLRQWVTGLSPEQSEDFINDAWRDIREANDSWSFLSAQEYWLAPSSITLTGIGVTQFSNSVILNYSSLLSIAGLNNPPITQRQIRIGLQGGPIYEIAGTDTLQVVDGAITSGTDDLSSASGPFDAAHVGRLIVISGAGSGGSDLQTTILSFVSPTQVQLATNALTTVGPNATVTWGSSITLSRNYNETTNSNTNGLLYRVYYSPLTQDFQRIDHLSDPITGYEFGYHIRQLDELDRKDPQRSSFTEPCELYYHHFDPVTGLPVYELWPGPTVQRAYTVAFWRLGLPFVSDTDSLPPQITEELLLLRARYLAYEWGAANDPDPRRRQTFLALMGNAKSKYSTEGQPGRPLGLLDQAMRRDEEVGIIHGRTGPRRPGPGWPVDSNFAQSHAIPGWWSGGY